MAKKAMKAMKKGMKAKKGVKSMSKGAISDALATACEKKRSEMGKILDALAELATKETKSTGKFTIPGVCVVKTRHKPATKAGKRMAFGKEVMAKAKPARTVVNRFAVKALKQCV
jgi:nucleoid DNA-binding protein